MKPAALRQCLHFKSSYNLKNDSDLVIGDEARAFISDDKNNGMWEKRVKEFHGDVKKYLIKYGTANVCIILYIDDFDIFMHVL